MNPFASRKPIHFRILVVDDDPDCAQRQAEWLRLAGHDVIITMDGQSALRLAEQLELDLILLDLGMPGTDGWEVANVLRTKARTRNLLIIAISGYGSPQAVARSAEVGLDFHLIKPATSHHLEAILTCLQWKLAKK
jgi:two-component system CheB/CheR fusion protein